MNKNTINIRKFNILTDIRPVIDLYNKYLTHSKWDYKDIIELNKKRNIFFVLIENGNVVGLINGHDIEKVKDPKLKVYFINKSIIIVSDIISTVKGGGSELLQYISTYKKDTILVSINKETNKFYEKNNFVRVTPVSSNDRRLIMIKYLSDTEMLINRMKTIVIFKDDTTHSMSKKFYKSIIDIIHNVYGEEYKYELFLYDISEYNKLGEGLKYGDVIIGFGEGGLYSSKYKIDYNGEVLTIGIGCPNHTNNDILITNDNDLTHTGDKSYESLSSHWTLDNGMKYDLTHTLRDYKKKTNK